MEALGGVASIIAVVDLSAKVLSLCSQYFKEVKNARSDIENLRNAVGNVQTQHEKTRTLLEGRMGFLLETSQQLIKGHNGCRRELEDLESILEQNINTKNGSSKVMRKFGRRALKWPFEAATVQGTTKKLKEFQEDMTRGLIIDQTGLELSNIEHSFFQAISSIPSEKHHSSNSEKRTSNTCKWLLLHEKFVEWQNSISQMILWLQGPVGVGKTCLVSKAVDHMKRISQASPDEGFAFFYCDHQEELRRKPVSIFQSLLRQLLLTSKGHHQVRQELYNRWQSEKSQELGLKLEECQEYLCHLVNESAKTTIILDAMDECEPKSRRTIIEGFKDLSKKCHKPLRILVASRPERDIRNMLSADSNIEVREEYNEADIQVFVEKEIVNHENWNNMPYDLQLRIEATIMDQSQGMFQWAALQVQQLLEQESISNIQHRLGRLPNSLKGTYDELFDAIRIRKGTDRLLAENALKWVMCAVAPLGKEELLSAIRLEIESDEFILLETITEGQLLKLCNHLLVFDTERDVWKFAHFSVAEYLEEVGLGAHRAHSDVAKACLKLLNQTPIDHAYYTTSKLTSDLTATDDILQSGHSIQVYSRHHWIVHARTQEFASEEEQDDGNKHTIDISLSRQLQKFMGSFNKSSLQYRRWLRQIVLDHHPPRTTAFVSFYHEDYNTSSRTFKVSTTREILSMILLKDWWEADYDIFQINYSGYNLLALAAAGGSVPVCEELLRRGINDETQRTNCVEALVEAVDHGHDDVVKLLIKTGKIDPNAKIKSHGNILVRAIVRGKFEKIRTIVQECQATVNAVLGKDDYGNQSAVKGGLAFGEYSSALAAAAGKGRLETVKYLVEEGQADVDRTLEFGTFGSALAAAAYNGHLEIVKFLVQKGRVDVNKVLKIGTYGSALAAAATQAKLEVVKFLVQEGQADVNQVLVHGRFGSALVAAAYKGHLEIVKFLVQESQADVNMLLDCGNFGSVLAAAAFEGHLEVVKFLVQEGQAEINTPLRREYFGTALAYAASRGNLEIVRFLVEECGAKIDLPEDIRLEHGLQCDAIEAARSRLDWIGVKECLAFLEAWESRCAGEVVTNDQV